MAVGRWTHVCEAVSTRDGGKKQMWIDGELVAEVANEGAAVYAHNEATFNMVLGDKCESCPNRWNGAIDDVKMWDVAITQKEVEAAFEDHDVETEDDHEAEEEAAPETTTEALEPGTSNDGSELPATIDPFPATCSYSRSGYNPATDTCRSGTHISQLTKVDLGQGYWAFADATGKKLIPIDEGGSAGGTVPYGSSLTTILDACTAKDGCRAIATDNRQTSWMKSTQCMSPCFRTYVNWYMAFNDESPSPFNPDRAETEDDHEAEEEAAPETTTEALEPGTSNDGSELPATIDPFPATCSYSRSGYNPATDTCRSGTHISQLTKVDLGQGYWAFADATGKKLIPIDEGGSAGGTVPYGSSLTTILDACTAKDGCRAIATDNRQTSWMKSTQCMVPCFRTYVNWYMAFNDESPSPFNPDRQS
jgi:hypothetical protein